MLFLPAVVCMVANGALSPAGLVVELVGWRNDTDGYGSDLARVHDLCTRHRPTLMTHGP